MCCLVVFLLTLLAIGFGWLIYFSKKLTSEQCLWWSFGMTIFLAAAALVDIKDLTQQNSHLSNSTRFIFWSKAIKFFLVVFATIIIGVFAIKKEAISSNELALEINQNQIREDQRNNKISETVSQRVKLLDDKRTVEFAHRLDEKTKQIIDHFITALAENGKVYDKKQDKVLNAVDKSGRLELPAVHIDSLNTKKIPNNSLRFKLYISNRGGRAVDGRVVIFIMSSSFNQFYAETNAYFTFSSLDKGTPDFWILDKTKYNPFIVKEYFFYLRVTYFDALKKYPFNEEMIIVIDPKMVKSTELEFATGNTLTMLLNKFKEKFPELR